MIPETVRSGRQHTHKPNGGAGESLCPYCGQRVSRKQFENIRGRIEAEEKARLANLEKALAAKAEAEVEKTKREAAAQIEKAREETAAREASIRKQAIEAATATLAAKVTEAVNAEKTKAYAEKLKLTGELEILKRKLENKTAHDRGEPAEVDLLQVLETAFPADRIWRVPKGRPGPDVIMEVIHQGAPVGKIAFDSKDHARWSSKFTSKLAADARNVGAQFAILSSNTLPAGESQICIRDNVIVAIPARVVVLSHLTRRQIIEGHRLRLSDEERNTKGDKLLAYIVSPVAIDLMDRTVKLTDDMVSLGLREMSAHEATWRKRAELVGALRAIHDEYSSAVSGIIGGGA